MTTIIKSNECPYKLQQKLTIVEKIKSVPEDLFDSVISTEGGDEFYSQFFKTIFNTKFEKDFEMNNEIIIKFKEYKYLKMKEFMQYSKFISPDSLSSSQYLSIEILKEFPKFKWNWQYVSCNFALTNRDILNNKDLPWELETLLEREDFSKEMLRFMGFFKSFPDEIPDTLEYSNLNILLSPIDPPNLKSDNINVENGDTTINESIDILISNYPEYFKDISPKMLEMVRLTVIDNINTNGEFLLEEFDFPSEDYKNKEKSYLIDEDEEDPFELKQLIKESRLSEYFEKLNIKSSAKYKLQDLNILPISRKSYLKVLEMLKNVGWCEELMKTPFFELEDLDNYPNIFSVNSYNKDKVMLKSGKISLENIINGSKKWNLEDLITCLDQEWVFENILFNKDIYKNNFINNSYKESYNLKKLMSYFASREDFNCEYLIQFPELFFGIEFYRKNPLFSNTFDNIADYIEYEDMTWNDLKTKKGRELMIEFDRIDNIPEKITDSFLLNEYKILRKHSPDLENIKSNFKVKWEFPINFDFLGFYNSLKDNYPTEIIMKNILVLIVMCGCGYISKIKNKIDLFFYKLISANKITYDQFVEFYKPWNYFISKIDLISFDIYKLHTLFRPENIKTSKYTYWDNLVFNPTI